MNSPFTHNVVPLIEEIDFPDSIDGLFLRFAGRRMPFLLDSSLAHDRYGRFSFTGSDPYMVASSDLGVTHIVERNLEYTCLSDPLDTLGRCLEKYRMPLQDFPVPFTGGAVGYLSYDMGRYIEDLPARAFCDVGIPGYCFGFYDRVVALDNLEHKAYIISNGLPETGRAGRVKAARRLEELKRIITADRPPVTPGMPGADFKAGPVTSNFTREEYIRAVEKARQYIIEGDIFEVNLSQRFKAATTIPPFQLYRILRRINPAPFACYLDTGDLQVISASPERFLKINGDTIETRPIKGTRPRGSTAGEDKAMSEELSNSAKDKAENIMIVDLERNDLGKICRFGSVNVDELAILEEFPTVFHLTSTVKGRLREGITAMDVIRAAFPGGSITGAPKVRAMEIIDELEPVRRNIYTGSIGYIGSDGNLDLNIAIRTMIMKDGLVYFHAGGAVTYDSDPEMEYVETLHKARALIAALTSGDTSRENE
ncbi:MAG: aminodeoxychorismate synthase component I [Dehalococcoidaceae bacterium]|nr:aminodeoxychorismate synthase component I [Dehalococcoidaceae bacterium]